MNKQTTYQYIQYLIKNIKLRQGTKIPLVQRDPFQLVLKTPKVKKQEEYIPNLFEFFFSEKKINKSIEKNEQILSIVNTLKTNPQPEPNKHLIKSHSFITSVDLPKLKTQSRNKSNKLLNLQSLNINDNHQSSKSISNSNESKSNNQLLFKSEKKKTFKLSSIIVIKSFYVRSKASENFNNVNGLHVNAINKKHNNKDQNTNIISSLLFNDLVLSPISCRGKSSNKPLNKDAYITKVDFISKTFGKVSLFGILHGIGENGSIVSKAVRNFIVNYFEKQDIETTINKDNYYTILANVFLNANEYLLKNISDKYDLDNSGTTCQLLFFPNDGTQNIYCTNAGNSKTMLYSYTESVPLSYEHYPSRTCEKDHILKEGKDVNIVSKNVSVNEGGINKEQSLIMKVNKDSKGGFHLSRVLGCFYWKDAGVTADPEVIECNLNREGAKVIVMGTDAFWKYLTKDTVGEIVIRHYNGGNVFAASKELEETARLKWRKYNKEIDDITVIVAFLKREKYQSL